jgi:aryl-alcohol dehydrogenase-like predicted oxidoreductase
VEHTTLGRSGLRVSVAGLGCGGHSRLGTATGKSEQESVAVVRQALDLGISLVDTAEAYGTEAIVGKALQDVRRDQVVIATKKLLPPPDHPDPAGELRHGLEQSLRRLGTDYVDIYFLHGVRPGQYRFAHDVLVPVLIKMREQGKLRFIGITEAFSRDSGHDMLQQAVQADCWDVMMVGFNVLNQSARSRVFPHTQAKNIGVLGMFAVRTALSQPPRLKALLAELKDSGQVAAEVCDAADPLGFLTQGGKAASLPEAAYRYCRYEPGIDVVLTGTGNVEHLKANVAALLKPPLVEGNVRRIADLFGRVDSVSGN